MDTTEYTDAHLDNCDAYRRGLLVMSDPTWVMDNCDCDSYAETDTHDHQCSANLSDSQIEDAGVSSSD